MTAPAAAFSVVAAAGAAAVAVAASVGACSRPTAWSERDVDPALVVVDRDRLRLRTDTVGHDQWERRATFVLVDAANTHDRDLMVTLGGALVDRDGRDVSRLRAASLRIPAGGVRTFALIDRDLAAREGAAGARVEVAGAYVPNYPPPVQIADGRVSRHGGRVVVSGRVHNTADRRVRVLIIAGFYDADGAPMTRPYTELSLDGDTSHPAQFVGPEGSVKGYMFVGDLVY